MSGSSKGKWSVLGTIVSAPVRGYYYAGRVKAIKRPVDGSSSPPLYSVIFSNPLGCSVEEQPGDDCLILDFPAEQLIGRSFEPVTKALLSENQKVFITYRSREVSAHVLHHDTEQDIVRLKLDTVDPGLEMSVKLHEVRLLPSRKSGRLQEHPDYSLLANGRRSPDEERNKSSGSGSRRRTTSTSSTSLLANESSQPDRHTPLVSAHIDVPSSQNLGRKRRPSNPDQMDECAAAMVLMSLSASPRSPTCFNERLLTTPTKIYKCTWPGCKHETLDCSNIEEHVRHNHLHNRITDDEELMSGEEEFYYTEVDLSGKDGGWKHQNSSGSTHSSGPESPVSLSEDAASSSSGSGLMTNGDNSMDSNPPSPLSSGHHFFKSNSAFIPVQHYRHLEDHEYNRKPDPAGISILGSSRRGGGVGRKGTHSSTMLSSSSSSTSHPINIPMEHSRSMTMSASFGGFSGASSLSSGFGSFTSSLGSSFSPVSPPRSSGSLSSSFSNASNKYLRIGQGRGGSGTTILQSGNGFGGINRTSPTKRVRGETRKCRKVYGMDKKDAWCTQCKWKKACTRFTD